MLDLAYPNAMLDEYLRVDGNNSRNLLRKYVADNWNRMFGSNSLAFERRLERASGNMSRRKITDKVDRCVLLTLISGAVSDQTELTTDACYNHINLIIEALTDETKCHGKRRGLGRSWGFNKAMDKRDNHLVRLIKSNIKRYQSIPPTPPQPTKGVDMSEVMYANTVIAIHNQTLVHEGHISMSASVTYPDEATVKKIMGTVPVEHVLEQGERERIVDAVAASVQLMSMSPEWPSVDHLMSDATNPDNFNVKAIEGAADENAADDAAMAEFSDEPTASPPASWSINESMKPAIDQLLASGGSSLTFDQMVQQHNDVVSENLKLVKAVNTAPIATMPKAGASGDLTYEVVMRSAQDVFQRKVKALKFDIPTLIWRDDTGAEVQHPQCPDIDETYEFRPDHLIKFLSAHLFGLNPWLHGHTGTGKTTLCLQVAARIGFPTPRMNLDGNIERADMVGSKEMIIENGVPVTTFVEGILPKAMQMPCFLILDEFDAGRDEVMFVLQRALEKKGLVLTEDGGRVVECHPLFRFVATANSRGQGDEYGWYSGVRPVNVATMDRFQVMIEVDYLDKSTETKLLTNKYPNLKKSDAEEMAQFATEIRTAFKAGELSTTISPRGMDGLCMFFLHMSDLMPDRKTALKKALEVVITDRAPMDSRRTVIEMADRVFS